MTSEAGERQPEHEGGEAREEEGVRTLRDGERGRPLLAEDVEADRAVGVDTAGTDARQRHAHVKEDASTSRTHFGW